MNLQSTVVWTGKVLLFSSVQEDMCRIVVTKGRGDMFFEYLKEDSLGCPAWHIIEAKDAARTVAMTALQAFGIAGLSLS
jgi:hypothetical protein